jgi:hypothetical protein
MTPLFRQRQLQNPKCFWSETVKRAEFRFGMARELGHGVNPRVGQRAERWPGDPLGK